MSVAAAYRLGLPDTDRRALHTTLTDCAAGGPSSLSEWGSDLIAFQIEERIVEHTGFEPYPELTVAIIPAWNPIIPASIQWQVYQHPPEALAPPLRGFRSSTLFNKIFFLGFISLNDLINKTNLKLLTPSSISIQYCNF